MSIRCGQCGVEKKETNHWWLVYADKGGVVVIFFSEAGALYPNHEPVCGLGCAVRAVEKCLVEVLGTDKVRDPGVEISAELQNSGMLDQ